MMDDAAAPVALIALVRLSNPYTIFVVSGVIIAAWLGVFLLVVTRRRE